MKCNIFTLVRTFHWFNRQDKHYIYLLRTLFLISCWKTIRLIFAFSRRKLHFYLRKLF